ncbi:HORMA-1 domain-containing protein [Streptomyces halstedii]|uniref:HORMA-1 domain-containing protein n=1 Tax=Streptomyces halstedii TaxID=1944 RepID=UPI003688F122
MSSYTYAESFTRVHARRLAGRVATDLRQSHVLYGVPSSGRLDEYRLELEELLLGGYVAEYQFGFEKSDQVVWSLRYKVGPDGSLGGAGSAGGVPHGLDISDANWFNFLTFSNSWYLLGEPGRDSVNTRLPFVRTTGSLPSDGHGQWITDRTYSAGGVEVQRTTFRSWL